MTVPLSNVFNSIKEKNSLRKRNKGMSNIYLKVTIETFSTLRLSGFKTFCHQVSFGELQLTQI